MDINIKLHNKWDIAVTNIKTGEKRDYKAENIILNQFWTRYLSANNATCLSFIHFGSGTDAPVATNTKLTTPVGAKAAGNMVVNQDDFESDGLIIVQKSCRLEANEYDGETIAEVGFAYSATTSGNLVTHALVKDMNGNAVTITIGVDEVVDIYGTFYFDLGQNELSGRARWFRLELASSINLPRMLICNSAFANTSSSSSGWSAVKFSDIAEAGIGNGDTLSSLGAAFFSGVIATVGYDTSSKTLTFTVPDLAVGSGNITGAIRGLGLHDFHLTLPCTGFAQPVIVKEVVGTGNGSDKDFSTDYGFVLDNSTFIAYVNDSAVNATCDFAKPSPPRTLVTDLMKNADSVNSWFGQSMNTTIGNSLIFENPYYTEWGLTSATGRRCTLEASNDLVTWNVCVPGVFGTSPNTQTINNTYKGYRYFRAVPSSADTGSLDSVSSSEFVVKNIHLESAPAEGDTVAVTYQPDLMAKDDTRILKNVSVAFTFAEYTP